MMDSADLPTVPPAAAARWLCVLRAAFPGFATFEDAGAFEQRRAPVDRLAERLRAATVAAPDIEGRGEAALAMLLDGENILTNDFVTGRLRTLMKTARGETLRLLGALAGAARAGSAGHADAVAAYRAAITALDPGMRSDYPRQHAEMVLLMLAPEVASFHRKQTLGALYREATGAPFPKIDDPAAEHRAETAFAQAAAAALDKAGARPRDMIDLACAFLAITGAPPRGGASEDDEAEPEMPTIAPPRTAPLNTILYGPPGTGKTYATASRAVAICDGAAPGDRAALMARYDDLRREGRIEFITFHQSYGYEDFVEGLRPQTGGEDGADAAGFRLTPEDGVLKRMASRARSRPAAGAAFDFADRRVFKVSLGRHNHPDDQALREECLADGWFMLGWGGEIDWSKKTYASLDDIAAEWRSQPGEENVDKKSGDIAQTNSMVRRMRPGDVVVASRGNSHICAIGLVDGPYEFRRREEDEYHHRRKIDWTWKAEDDTGIEASDIYGRNLTQASINEMALSEVRKDALAAYLAPARHGAPPPHVLIIDEINRANVSKVMGELITLLEEDKRAGAVNALSVTLPFSKESFSLPANLHILGAMNTADRSIALLDTALRRRFRFEHLGPDPSVLSAVGGVDLPAALRAMNDRLEWLLGPDHLIGHAWFMGAEVADLAALDRAMRDKVIPLLREYFHEDLARVRAVLGGGDGFLRREKLAPPPGIDDGYEARHRFVDAWDAAAGYGPAAWAQLIGATPA